MSAEQHFKKAMAALGEALQYNHSVRRIVVAAGMTKPTTTALGAISTEERVKRVEESITTAQGELRGLLHVLSQTASVSQSAADAMNLHRATMRKLLSQFLPVVRAQLLKTTHPETRAQLTKLINETEDHLRAQS